MVQQFWLWKLDEGEEDCIILMKILITNRTTDTIITAFPGRYHEGVEDTLIETIRDSGVDEYRSPEELIEHFLLKCVTFLERFNEAGLKIHILDIFESSIAETVCGTMIVDGRVCP